MDGISILYVGEGQEGDQKLARGNRALTWAYFEELPVHVFLYRGVNQYKYQGPHAVQEISASIGQDRNGDDRGAFVFRLVPCQSSGL